MHIWFAALFGALTLLSAEGDQDLLDRFRKVPEHRRQAILEQVEGELQALDLPLVHRVQELLKHSRAPRGKPPFFDQIEAGIQHFFPNRFALINPLILCVWEKGNMPCWSLLKP